MAGATHAAVLVFRYDPAREDAQLQGLRDFIVPDVRRVPGFVAGYWTADHARSETVTFITFGSLRSAEAFAESTEELAPRQLTAGIELLSLRVVEIVARA